MHPPFHIFHIHLESPHERGGGGAYLVHSFSVTGKGFSIRDSFGRGSLCTADVTFVSMSHVVNSLFSSFKLSSTFRSSYSSITLSWTLKRTSQRRQRIFQENLKIHLLSTDAHHPVKSEPVVGRPVSLSHPPASSGPGPDHVMKGRDHQVEAVSVSRGRIIKQSRPLRSILVLTFK